MTDAALRPFHRGSATEITVGSVVVAVIVAGLSVAGISTTLLVQSPGALPYWALASPALLSVYFSLEALWRRDAGVFSGWGRTLTPGSCCVIAVAVIDLLVGVVLVLSGARVEGEPAPTLGDAIFQAIAGWGLLGFVALLLGMIAGLLLISLPVVTFARLDQAEALPVSDRREIGRNRAALFGLNIVLILVFVVPSFVVFGSRYDNPDLVAVGWWLIPVGVLAVVAVVVLQRGAGLRTRAAEKPDS